MSVTDHLTNDQIDAAALGYLGLTTAEHLISCSRCCHAVETAKRLMRRLVHSQTTPDTLKQLSIIAARSASRFEP
jgi:hypothetical protein